MSERARQTLPAGAIAYPEAPRWYRDALWFSDVHNFRLMRCGLAGDPTVVAEVPGRPSGMGVTPDGRLLLATAMEKALHWVEDDGLVAAVDLAPLTSGLLNDMIVDAQGRAYVGDTGYDLGAGASPAPGRILVWDRDDKPRSVVEDVTFPNGMAITPDGKTLYVAETFAERVSAFDIGRDGDLSGRSCPGRRTGCVSMPTVPYGSPVSCPAPSCASIVTAPSSIVSMCRPIGQLPACWAAPTAAPCSCARPSSTTAARNSPGERDVSNG
jgi:sugar lactone lactonase YvrE